MIAMPLLVGKCIAFVGDDALDSGNEFLKLSLAVNTFAVTDSVMVAGQRRSVNKLMLCKKSWVENNWINPMQRVQAGKSTGPD